MALPTLPMPPSAAIVFGAALAPTVITNMTTAVTTTGIGSFAGTAGILVLIPFIFASIVVISSIAFIVVVVYKHFQQ